jgi:hypothetical protein
MSDPTEKKPTTEKEATTPDATPPARAKPIFFNRGYRSPYLRSEVPAVIYPTVGGKSE